MFELVFMLFLVNAEPIEIVFPGYRTLEECINAGSEYTKEAHDVATEIAAYKFQGICRVSNNV